MTGEFRTAAGGRVDRAKSVRFFFDGKPYSGLAGDTLATALLASGVHLMGRSFKYHRPRGPLSLGSDEPNALATLDAGRGRVTPNLRATQIELYEGLKARSQNAWPSLQWDAMAVNGIASALFPAGFYYKTFMGPQGAWENLYEPAIRRAAGLGVARGGARCILFDEQAEMGGSLLAETQATIDGRSAAEWVASAVAELAASPRVTLLPRTQVFGYYAQNFLAAQQRLTDHLANPDRKSPRERLWQVRAKQVVLATGAHERPLVFPDNDRPGIMLAESARTLATRYGVKPGAKVVVATSHDGGYRAALDFARAGCEIVMIADSRETADGMLPRMARRLGLRFETHAAILGSRGGLRVTHARIAGLWSDGRAGKPDEIACDAIAMSGGWTPSVHLYSQSRGKLAFDEATRTFLPGAPAQAQVSVGACRGVFDLAAALAEGARAGAEAAGATPAPGPNVTGAFAASGGTLGVVAPMEDAELSKAFVDFQNDVTARDIRLATREGMRSIEHIKRYTTTGMATDQGKTSNMNALAIAAAALGKPIAEVGLTTFRLPYTPVTFATVAGLSKGALYDPIRETPLH